MNAKTVAALNVRAAFCHVRALGRGVLPPHTEHKGHIFACSQVLLKKPKQSSWGSSGVYKGNVLPFSTEANLDYPIMPCPLI